MSKKPRTLYVVESPTGDLELVTLAARMRDAIASFRLVHLRRLEWPAARTLGYQVVKFVEERR